MAIIPIAQAREIGMGKIALEIARDARHMADIAMLAVAPRQSRENAEDLRGALDAEQGEGASELALVEGPDRLPVPAQ